MSWRRLTAIAVRNELDVVGNVCRCLTSQRLVYQACNLVLDSLTDRQSMQLTVWCSGNTLVSINAVALHRARLVLGWVTADPGQLSLSSFRGR